jgi:hypothetical protein
VHQLVLLLPLLVLQLVPLLRPAAAQRTSAVFLR